ncbi:MAG: membrane protein insertion efficiency factor YidD [Pseudomonadota bacterium]|jgi:putative membrane protein insertion efficiency factor
MKKFVVSFIYLYRWLISPFLPPACKFTPTCSRYAISAIECHGVLKGLWMTLKRLLRCNPYNNADAHDPVQQTQATQTSTPTLPFSEPFSHTTKSTFRFASSKKPANSHQSKYKRAHNA